MKTEFITVRMTQEMKEALEKSAKRNYLSVGKLIRLLIEDYLSDAS